ncbi:hypothetical protein WHR41_04109 [Cladosporium halotolerans]|uniref:Auxin efflux carrier n=1 Tax=Cladosporium halotolerans TaxID=1052096 RepID=A0AB34KS68_9PEZI
MGQATQELLIPFLGALQASVAVLLTIFAGVLASQFQLIGADSSKEISKVAVRLFLPALLIVNVGSQLHADTGIRYVPIIFWSIFYQLASLGIGVGATKLFHLPQWVTPAFAFNNTTSLPLLLVQSLDASGILSSLDSSPDVVDRAKSYFLVNAMISNSFTFALGPKFLDTPEDTEASDDQQTPQDPLNSPSDSAALESQRDSAAAANEQTSLLPHRTARTATHSQYALIARLQTLYSSLPTPLRRLLSSLAPFLNPPFIGTCLGALIGLVPSLHTLFFADQQHGGYLNAWLTAALKNVGDLFAALQVIVVGIKLSSSLLKWKKGEASGAMPWGPWAAVTLVRFVLWPALSIPLVYACATRTGWLDEDPMLWFAMMLMPVGPPALSITAMADVSGAGEEVKLGIAKFLTVSYAVSPLICFSVVGALKASQAAAA